MHKFLPSIIIFLTACQEEDNKPEVAPENHSPGITSIDIVPGASVKTIDTVSCEFEATDIDGDDLQVEINWTNRNTGASLGTTASIQLSADVVDPGDEVNCEVTVTDPTGLTASDNAQIVVENSRPTIEQIAITAEEEGIHNDSELLCEAQTSDLDEDELQLSYQWEAAGEVLAEGKTIDLSEHNLSPGDSLDCVVEATDPYGQMATSKAEVSIANRVPGIESIEITSDSGFATSSLLTCSVSTSDADGDATNVMFRWYNESGDILGENETLQLQPSMVSVGDTIRCEVTVDDEHGDSFSQSYSVTLANSAPTWISPAQISPNQNIEANTELSCEASADDIDGETVAVSYQWQRAGETLASGASFQLDAETIEVADEITCLATAQDVHGEAISSAATVVVQNSLPQFDQSAMIKPKIGVTNSTLVECSVKASDLNDDSLEISYQWYNNTQQVVIGDDVQLQLSKKLAQPGDEIQCLVTVTDSAGETIQSNSAILIENTAPTFTAAPSIVPNTGIQSNTTLSCEAEFIDDGTDTVLSYVWTNETQGSELGTDAALTLSNADVQPGDKITCAVTATDAGGLTITQQVLVEVENTAPVFDSPAAISPNSDVSVSTQLSCSAVASDQDGDSPTLSYEWSNQTQGQVLGTQSTLDLDVSIVQPSDVVICRVTAVDHVGESIESVAQVTIINTAPAFSQLPTITTDNELKIGSTLTCAAAAEDADGGVVSLEYRWENTTAGSVLGSDESLLLSEGMVKAGDKVTCIVEATDDEGVKTAESASIELQNTAPYFVAEASISPNTGVFNDTTVSCSADAADVDGDQPIMSYEWINETTGAILANTASFTLQPSQISTGDTLRCNVTATDSVHEAATSTAKISIESAAPSFVAAASISPGSAISTSSVLTCSADAVDHNGQSVSVSYEWRNGTNPLGSGSSLSLTSSIAQPNDNITCIASAVAANGETTTSEITVIVENTSPAGLVAALSPADPVAGVDDINCEVSTDAADADGDSIAYNFVWHINDQEFTGLVNDGVHSGDILPAASYQVDDEIECKIIASDGTAQIEDIATVNATGPVDPLVALSDEFDTNASLNQWSRLNDTEQWGANQLESVGLDTSHADMLALMPYASGWDTDFRGALLFKEVTGNFVVTTSVTISNRNEDAAPNVIGSLGGLMVRTPKATDASSWVAGQENYLLFGAGAADTADTYQLAAKNTTNSVSDSLIDTGAAVMELRVARIHNTLITLYRLPSDSWQVYERYSRADMPAMLQVGLTATTDWDSISSLDSSIYNNAVLTSANPDLLAAFDYVRYVTPEIDPMYASIDFSDDSAISDADVLTIFGMAIDE